MEGALGVGGIEVGVHSLKQKPERLAPGLAIGAVPARAPAHDVLCAKGAADLAGLPAGARVGTSSVRRRALLLARRRDLAVVPLPGNVGTRRRRRRGGGGGAVILAAAG